MAVHHSDQPWYKALLVARRRLAKAVLLRSTLARLSYGSDKLSDEVCRSSRESLWVWS